MATLRFDVVGHGPVKVEVTYTLNGGYAGRDTKQVRAHVDELAELGVPGPGSIPTLYPLPSRLAVQGDQVQVPHGKTSGEAEWALVVPVDADDPDDYLVTAACDHTDRALEVHGVAWSKQSAPDFLGDLAWRWGDIREVFDGFRLVGRVTNDGVEETIQDGSPAQLLGVDYWVNRLGGAGLLKPGTVFLSGTIPMLPGVDQFADVWAVELADAQGQTSRVRYDVELLPAAWQ